MKIDSHPNKRPGGDNHSDSENIANFTSARFVSGDDAAVIFSGRGDRDRFVTIPISDFLHGLYKIPPDELKKAIADCPPIDRGMLPEIVKAITAGAMVK